MTYLKASDILAFSVLMNLFHLVDFYFTNEKLNGTFIQTKVDSEMEVSVLFSLFYR